MATKTVSKNKTQRTPTLDRKAIGKRVRDEREARKFKGHECPGLTKAMVSLVETGKHAPTGNTLCKLSYWLDLRADWILFGLEPQYTYDLPVAIVGDGASARQFIEQVRRILKNERQLDRSRRQRLRA